MSAGAVEGRGVNNRDMGIHDRRYSEGGDRGGGFGAAMRRIFVEGDGFYGWSLPLLRVPDRVPGIGGIEVRVHLLYILIAGSELLASSRDGAGAGATAAMMGMLFVLVLLHEFGHCLACRLVGGEADQVLMWPLGGLAFCRPPQRWKPALITTIAGPGVNAVLAPVLGAALLAAGAGWGAVVFNPLSPGPAWLEVHRSGSAAQWWLWSAHYMNLVLLAFNMLVPMFPMDCGRVVQEVLWARLGYKRSMQIAVNVGLVVAVALGLYGVATSSTRLMALAIFGGITCYNERQRLKMLEDEPAWAYDTDRGYRGFGEPDGGRGSRREYREALKRQKQEQERDAQVDRVLAKIATRGMQSLTGREKKLLEEASERTRRRG